MRIKTFKLVADKLTEDQICSMLRFNPAIYFHAINKTRKILETLLATNRLMASHVKKLDLTDDDMSLLLKESSQYRYRLDNFFDAFKRKPDNIVKEFIKLKFASIYSAHNLKYNRIKEWENKSMFLISFFPTKMRYKPTQDIIDLVEKKRQILILSAIVEM